MSGVNVSWPRPWIDAEGWSEDGEPRRKWDKVVFALELVHTRPFAEAGVDEVASLIPLVKSGALSYAAVEQRAQLAADRLVKQHASLN